MEEPNQEPKADIAAAANNGDQESDPKVDEPTPAAEAPPEAKEDKPQAKAEADSKTQSYPEATETKAEAKPKTGQPGPQSTRLQGSPLVGLLIGAVGIFTVCGLGLFVYYDQLPYLLTGLDTILDAKIRYQATGSVQAKDWHKDFLDEQALWTNEVSKIKLGTSGAKPVEYKRDYLLFLADSYYRDQPHFMEAKAAYMAAKLEPRVTHEHSYDLSDGELDQRIGYCALRLGFYSEAEEYLNKALASAEAITDPQKKIQHQTGVNAALDALTECAIRTGHYDQAEALLKRRLTAIHLTDSKGTIEVPILLNYALLREAQGNLKEAEEYYLLAIRNNESEDQARGVIKGSANDNSRRLAFVLREYARLLRKEKRPDESYSMMQRALCLVNNAP